MLIFRQLFDPQSSTYTYLLGDPKTRKAVLIDTVFEQARRDLALIEELELELLATIETHVHADHVTGAWLLKQAVGSRILLSKAGNAEGVDTALEDGDAVDFGSRHLIARATPGHTDSCMSFVLDDRSMAFTGDTLLIRGCGRTDFQQGNAGELYHSIHEKIFTLPGDCMVYPGHDYRGLTSTSVDEERRHNPRLGGEIQEADFVGYMDNLNLPHPKQIAIAVPANLKCGRREDGIAPDEAPSWAPLAYTFAGIWEVQPQWVEENANAVQMIDVREADEFTGPLGHVDGSSLIPLGELEANAEALSKDRPIVAICRSGARSAQATLMLRKAGFEDIANMAGGMLRWRSQRLPVVGGQE